MEHKGANDMERGSPVQDGGKRGGPVTSADMRCLPFRAVWFRQRVKLSHFSTAAQSELFDTNSESDPAQSQHMPGASKLPRPLSACAVCVRTRPQRGLAGVFAYRGWHSTPSK